MKRFLCFLLICALLISLGGCGVETKSHASFYYPRTEFQFGTEDGVIHSETRDIAGHEEDLFYLTALYLAGPLEEDLYSPFHASTLLISVEQNGDEVIIHLTDSGVYMLDSEFSLACACLSLTCMEISDAASFTVKSQDRSVTMSRDNMTILDQPVIAAATEE